MTSRGIKLVDRQLSMGKMFTEFLNLEVVIWKFSQSFLASYTTSGWLVLLMKILTIPGMASKICSDCQCESTFCRYKIDVGSEGQ